MNANEEIIEKIKKLLRLKRGGTPDEIATALRLAQELAAKHGVNLDQVNPDDDAPKSERIGHEDPIASARIQCECKFAGLICQQFFNVEVFTTAVDGHLSQRLRVVFKRALRFVGTEWDRQIAIYVFHFLVRHFRREWNTNSGRLRNREAFMWGMYCGLCAKLEQRQPKPTEAEGLVHTGRKLARRNYIEANFGELKGKSVAPDTNAVAAQTAGWRAGQATEIRPAVDGAKEKQLLLG